MAALVASNGILTISNTTDTYTAPNADKRFLPTAMVASFSTAGRMIVQDADGVTLLDLPSIANNAVTIDSHFFLKGIALWKSPIKGTGSWPAGAKLRLYGMA